jgi:predicted SnoaL-like aldol condensation-catalyzing enzyme
MNNSSSERNKAFMLEAFETLFNKRDYVAAERFWSPSYIQHSAHIAPGREGLFSLVRSAPETLHYENQLIIAEGDYVIAHGRFTGMGRPAAWIAVDVIRFDGGLLKENWDVLQDEATKAESVSAGCILDECIAQSWLSCSRCSARPRSLISTIARPLSTTAEL